MAINSRAKGAVGEREWAAFLRERGFDARRGQQFSGSPDSPDVVANMPGLHPEVKRVERLNIEQAMAKAEEDCGEDVPYIAHRRNRKEWMVTMKAKDWADIMRCAYAGGWKP